MVAREAVAAWQSPAMLHLRIAGSVKNFKVTLHWDMVHSLRLALFIMFISIAKAFRYFWWAV